MKYKLAIVGTREITVPFMALGFDAKVVQTSEQALEVLFQLKKEKQDAGVENSPNKYAIIFVLEDFMKDIAIDDYKKLSSGALPAIIPIPSQKGASGFGETKIRRIVERAVGSDIFGDS
ncbi:hypothetical protein COB57_04830 [Candidatus Peregrinibacteria bacterium]|nr:MAG: hypothetical protein COB57_04830 [Candidatus Peregrinibacteria bacterium]